MMSKLKQLLFSLNETDRKIIEETLKEKDDKIKQLKQQLAEKQNTIDEINKEFVQAVHDWKTLCAEKDKEIERLKNLFELNNEVVINQGKEMFDLRVQVLQQKQNQIQDAITELEKVKNFVKNANGIIGFDWRIDRFKVIETIDNQIKALKGNNDEPRQSN